MKDSDKKNKIIDFCEERSTRLTTLYGEFIARRKKVGLNLDEAISMARLDNEISRFLAFVSSHTTQREDLVRYA